MEFIPKTDSKPQSYSFSECVMDSMQYRAFSSTTNAQSFHLLAIIDVP